MHICKDIPSLRKQIETWRRQNQRIAFVPTMGNLHAGHLSLVERAAKHGDRVVVSIYVNPLQFAPNEDFDSYPRTLQADLAQLETLGVDCVFTPDDALMYPQGRDACAFVEVPGLGDMLEGECRPGFFRGVATVVLKLFNLVQPDVAVFGEKDFQQLLVIRRLVNDFNLPIEILGAPIAREADGLAMSSRNQYLDADQRQKAPLLAATLAQLRTQMEQGAGIAEVLQRGRSQLQAAGFEVDYLTLRHADSLAEVVQAKAEPGQDLVLLAVARLGGTRLLDNCRLWREAVCQDDV